MATTATRVEQRNDLDRAIQQLRGRLLGEAITPDHSEYDAARRVWNKEFVRRPTVVVRAADGADAAQAVSFAREQNLPFAIRSGGHSLAGFGTVDGGVVLDMSRLTDVVIDRERRIARVQPGVTSERLAPLAAEHGLGLSTGDAPTVGLGGLTTGGGIGFMVRKFGLTIDSLRSARVVTADGQLVTASPDQDPDLFWAIRGGGGNFGVVTRFEFDLRPVGTVLGGALIHRATPAVLKAYADRALEAPDALTTITLVIKAPPLPMIPAELHGQVVLLILLVHVGDVADGQRALQPLRDLAPGCVDLTQPMPYPAIFDLTRGPTASSHSHTRSSFLDAFPAELAETIVDFVERGSSPGSFAQLRPLGGEMARVPAEATAFAHRDKPYLLALINDWHGPDPDPTPHRAWTEAFWQAVRPFASGAYVNFLGLGEDERIKDAYPEATYRRLVEVKRRYDPTNFFRLNQNVRPA